MAKSMNEASRKSSRRKSPDSGSAISSPESECGVTPCGSPAGPTTDLFGQEVAPVPASARQDKAEGLMTLVTSGLIGRDSSASADLQRSLESRLMMRLDTAGSTLFKLTWKGRTTPLGRRYLERAALARRTSGSGCTSWPTPQTHDERKRGNTEADHHSFPHDLSNMAEMASWPTPNNDDCNTTRDSGKFQSLTRTAQASGWNTPVSNDAEKRGIPVVGAGLAGSAHLASWPTPTGEDSQCAGSQA